MVLAMDGANVPTRPEEAKGKRRGRKKRGLRERDGTGSGKKQKDSGSILLMEIG